MKRFIAGIDPDLQNSGIAIWDRTEKNWVRVSCGAIEDLIDYLVSIQLIVPEFNPDNTTIYLEAGWKNDKSNFRHGFKSNIHEKITMNVGENHATSKIIGRLLRKAGWEVVEIAPLGKGKGFLKGLKGWTPAGKKYIEERSGLKNLNDEKRDAAYIVMAFR